MLAHERMRFFVQNIKRKVLAHVFEHCAFAFFAVCAAHQRHLLRADGIAVRFSHLLPNNVGKALGVKHQPVHVK